MAVDHVEVALGHWNVDRLAHRAARVMQRRRLIGELHEVAEVLDGGIAPALVEVAYERRPVDRCEHRVAAADLHRAGGIAGELGELARRRADQRPHQAPGKAHPVAIDVGAGLPPHVERFRIFAKVDTDLLQHCLGIVFDEGQTLLAQHFVNRNIPPDVGELLNRAAAAGGAARLGTASETAGTALACRWAADIAHGLAPILA